MSTEATTTDAHAVRAVAQRARDAAVSLAVLTRAEKDDALRAIADAIEERTAEIVETNKSDLDRAVAAGTAAGLVDRLTLDAPRLKAIADALRDVAELPDPVGEVIRGYTL